MKLCCSNGWQKQDGHRLIPASALCPTNLYFNLVGVSFPPLARTVFNPSGAHGLLPPVALQMRDMGA